MRVVPVSSPTTERILKSSRRAGLLAAALSLLCLAAPAGAALPIGPGGPGVAYKLTVDSGGVGVDGVGEVRAKASSNGQSVLANVCWHFDGGQGGSVGAEYTGSGAVAYFPFVGPGGGSQPLLSLPSGLADLHTTAPLPDAQRYGPGTQHAGASRTC